MSWAFTLTPPKPWIVGCLRAHSLAPSSYRYTHLLLCGLIHSYEKHLLSSGSRIYMSIADLSPNSKLEFNSCLRSPVRCLIHTFKFCLGLSCPANILICSLTPSAHRRPGVSWWHILSFLFLMPKSIASSLPHSFSPPHIQTSVLKNMWFISMSTATHSGYRLFSLNYYSSF